MADEDERRIVADLQAKAAVARDKPIEIHLPDRGPYILPRFPMLEGLYLPDTRTFELFLETEKGQRVRVPISGDQIDTLKMFVDRLVAEKNQQ